MLVRDDVIDYFREYESLPQDILERELKVPMESEFIISIIGPRRAGKTYFLFSLSKKIENQVYLNFEDPRLAEINYRELRDVIRIYMEIYGRNPRYLLLDEIQNMENWEKAVR
ncbi:MAG: AAA family ATPase, partial [Thermoplasmata archaeon]